MKNLLKRYDWKKYDYTLIAIVIILSMIGAFTVRLADAANQTAFFKAQIMGLIMGMMIVAIVSLIDYHFICRFVALYYIVGVLLVFASRYTPLGTDLSTHTYRWIEIGGITVQPTELVKIIVILTLSVYYSKMRTKLEKFYVLVLGGCITFVPMLFIMLQPDLSSSLVVCFIFLVIMFAAGTAYKILIPTISVTVPLLVVLLWYVQQPFQKIIQDYQQERIMIFLHPELDTSGKLWQQQSSQLAIASGQLYGKFLDDGGSPIRNYLNVPVIESDFIWSVIGEEYGFLGGLIIIVLYGILIARCLFAAKKAQDRLGMLIALGVSALFTFQVFANIGVATFILPNTGLPLPFLSNGLSSMLSCMIAIGLIVNISIQPAKKSGGGFTMRQNDRELDL